MTIFYHIKCFSTVNRGVNSYKADRKNCVGFEAIKWHGKARQLQGSQRINTSLQRVMIGKNILENKISRCNGGRIGSVWVEVKTPEEELPVRSIESLAWVEAWHSRWVMPRGQGTALRKPDSHSAIPRRHGEHLSFNERLYFYFPEPLITLPHSTVSISHREVWLGLPSVQGLRKSNLSFFWSSFWMLARTWSMLFLTPSLKLLSLPWDCFSVVRPTSIFLS